MPYGIITSFRIGIKEEFSARSDWPKCVGKLQKYLGVDGHVKLVKCFDLPILVYRSNKKFVSLRDIVMKIKIKIMNVDGPWKYGVF